MKEYQGFKKAEEEMKTKSGKIAADFQQINMQFQKKVQDYQKKRSGMTTKQATEFEQQLMQEQQMIQQQQQMIQQQYQEEGNQIIDKVIEEIQSKIEVYAKKNGYDFILGTSRQTKSVIYGTEKSDLTEKLIEELNKDLSSKQEVKTEIPKDSLSK